MLDCASTIDAAPTRAHGRFRRSPLVRGARCRAGPNLQSWLHSGWAGCCRLPKASAAPRASSVGRSLATPFPCRALFARRRKRGLGMVAYPLTSCFSIRFLSVASFPLRQSLPHPLRVGRFNLLIDFQRSLSALNSPRSLAQLIQRQAHMKERSPFPAPVPNLKPPSRRRPNRAGDGTWPTLRCNGSYSLYDHASSGCMAKERATLSACSSCPAGTGTATV